MKPSVEDPEAPPPSQRWRLPWRLAKRLLQTALWLALVYAGLLALLWWAQERLIFLPQRLPAEHRFEVPTGVQERWVEVPCARLNLLHLREPGARGVVFYLHGNAGSLQSWFVDVEHWRRAGLDLVMLDYRGYGKSSGRIDSEAQLHADVAAAWAQVAPEYAGRQRIVFGRSLGTGLAAALAAQAPAELRPELTVLVSPYTSLLAVAAEQHPWVPEALLARLLRYPLRTDQWLPQVQGRVALVHGGRDRLIPPEHSRRLQALVPQAQLLWLPDAGHIDLQQFDGYWAGLLRVFGGE